MPHATRNVGGSRTPHAQVQSLALSLFQWNIPRGAIVLLACSFTSVRSFSEDSGFATTDWRRALSFCYLRKEM
eukprot:7069837-Pyramimonas_sp.AAC.1